MIEQFDGFKNQIKDFLVTLKQIQSENKII